MNLRQREHYLHCYESSGTESETVASSCESTNIEEELIKPDWIQLENLMVLFRTFGDQILKPT